MSLILCRRGADKPFSHSKLNIGIKTEQELCYVIYNYPLLCVDMMDERLFSWIEHELNDKRLAEMLRISKRAGEAPGNQFLCILQECGYYDVNETVEFGKTVAELMKLEPYELMLKEGKLLYEAGKLAPAYDKIYEALRTLNDNIRRMKNGIDKARKNEKKADILCDLAVLALRMSDENKALELLISSEVTYYNKRAVKMRYLINGAGDLADDEKAELDKLKEEAIQKSHESKGYKDIENLFKKDSIKILKESRQIISRWKNNYRIM